MFDLIEVILPTLSLGTHDVKYIVFAVMIFFIWQNFKLSARLKKLELPKPLFDKKSSDWILTRQAVLEAPTPVGPDYIVPNEFPTELAPYVKHATLGEVSRWLLEIKAMEDQEKQKDIQRAITIGAVINRTYIPIQLFRVDDHTRVLWQRWKLDIAPVDPVNIITEFAMRESDGGEEEPPAHLERFVEALPTVGVLIAKHSPHWNFPAFMEFAERVRALFTNWPMRRVLTDEAIKSIVTVYAIKAVVKIPTSYVSYDHLTVLILRAASQKEPPRFKLIVSDPVETVDE